MAARGLFTGNRGIIHDADTRTLLKRRWSSKAWLICLCDFGDRRRDVMGRNGRNGGTGWTELFFLDEVTALAAGHRPCFFCRREAARTFASAFAEGHGGKHLSAQEMDERLHRQRRASGARSKPVDSQAVATLPDGAMVEWQGQAYALKSGCLLPWDFAGYGPPQPLDAAVNVAMITPPATLEALRRGYRPAWHVSAGP